MKTYSYLLFAFAIALFTSCSGKYDGAITDYIRTVDGQKMEMEVKLKETKEIKKITVGDSINYINLRAEQTLKQQVEAFEKQMAKYQEDLVKANTGASSRVIVEAYTKEIVRTQQTIDSLKAVKPEPTKLYDGKKTDQVLAIIVEGKYSTPEVTDGVKNFVLSPDGKVCYGETDNPEMSPEK